MHPSTRLLSRATIVTLLTVALTGYGEKSDPITQPQTPAVKMDGADWTKVQWRLVPAFDKKRVAPERLGSAVGSIGTTQQQTLWKNQTTSLQD